MKPSTALAQHRPTICAEATRFRATNPRVFGSTLHGTDASDLDLLVDPLPGATLFHLGGLQETLQHLLQVRVEILTPADLPAKHRTQILAVAAPV